MDVLVNFLNPARMGQLREVTKTVSLDDVAEMATSGFRSMSVQREDSLVFLLGLLNLGTILCYAVYSQLFKPARRSPSQLEDNPFVFKKIQTILDELVLHVHTTTYYSSSLEKSRELGKGLRDMTFSGRSAALSPIQSVFSFFDLAEPNLYGEKEPILPLMASSKRTMEDYQEYLQEEVKKLMQEWMSVVVEMMATPHVGGRLTKRQTRMTLPQTLRRNSTARHSSSSVPQLKKRVPVSSSKPVSELNRKSLAEPPTPSPTWKLNRERWSHRRPQNKRPVAADSTTRTIRSTTMSTTSTRTTPTSTTSAGKIETDGQESTTAPYAGPFFQPDMPHPNHQDVPVLPVHALFPHETVRDANRGNRRSNTAQPRRASSRSGMRRKDSTGNKNLIREESTTSSTTPATTTTTTTSSPAPLARHIASTTEFRQSFHRNPEPIKPIYDRDMEESASANVPVEEDNIIFRLMHLVQQTTPIAMDVLGVYQLKSDTQQQPSTEPKCLERLLCQLNQDWKGRGSVPAAMAPFFSIMTGWLLERSTAPNLSHVLMAVRAGWIGKQCSTLYPRCSSPGRPQWTVTPLYDDSLNLPSIGQPPVKVRPPFDFFVPSSTIATVHIDNTHKPHSSSVRTITSTKSPILQSSETADLRTTPSPLTVTNEGIKKTDKSAPASVRDSSSLSDASKPNQGVWGQHLIELEEGEQSTSALIRTSLQVDRNGGASHVNDRIDTVKPWGKPSRFSGSDTVELSDIVRGVYPPGNDKAQTGDEEDEEYEDDDEEEGDEEEEEEEEGVNEDDNHHNHHDQQHRLESESSTHKTAHHLTHDSIFHDLNKNHFTQKQPEENPTKIKDIYEEIQKKKTDRLEMVPHRGFVHPWLSEPVWVPENTWQSKADPNRLRIEEENEEMSDRHRDKVSFGHEDAVKDVRLFDFAMQYLRDRSAK